MGYSQKSIREMYRRVLDALPVEFRELPPDSEGAAAAQGLREQYDIIVGKSSAKVGFDGTAQEGTGQRAVARKNIREYMSTLARSAGSIARRKPGFDRNYPSPSGKSDAELLSEARAVAVKAMEDKTDFIGRGLKMEYLQSIEGFITSFESSLDTTLTANVLSGSAVGSKNAAYESAEDYFDVLDDFIRNFYRENPEKLAAWKIASHIRRSSLKDNEESEAPTT